LQVDDERQRELGINLATFCKNSRFQSGVCSIIANMMGSAKDLNELRNLFVKWDENNDGFLSK
jgi:hypothetical protein